MWSIVKGQSGERNSTGGYCSGSAHCQITVDVGAQITLDVVALFNIKFVYFLSGALA